MSSVNLAKPNLHLINGFWLCQKPFVYKTRKLANIQLGKEQSSFPKTICEDRKIKDFSISQIQKSLPAFFMSSENLAKPNSHLIN